MRHFSWFQFLIRRLRAFSCSESGMTLPLLGISMITITIMTGVAVDSARLQLVQSKLQFSLDAAGLAAGSTVNTSNLQAEVTKYLNANFNGYMGAVITGTSATVNSSNTVITLAATAQVPTTFLQVASIAQMTANANTQVSRSASGLEVVMVLDNTGSMAQSGKLTSLKTAATTLVNIITGGQASVQNLWMGLVPFSQTVNIGTANTSWLDLTTTNNWGPTSWAGCVDARVRKAPPVQYVSTNSNTFDMDISDDPPSISLFKQYYYHSDNSNCWEKTKIGGVRQCTDTGTGTPKYSSPLNTTDLGPNVYCPQQVTPMTGTASTITTAINAMTAQGNTHIDLGLAWGWRMLSPRWRGLWGGDMNANSLPLNYNTPHMNKAVVLLTDGENTMGCSNPATCGQDFSAYGYLEDGKLGTTNYNTSVTQLNNRMLQVCSSLKANNVFVYTIALGSGITSSIQSLLQQCATAPNYAFVSPTASELQTIFSTIGDSLSNLRVSR